MDPKTYQTEILQFESPVSEDQLDRLTAMAFPLHIAFTELIQLCEKLDKIKKHIYYGSEYDVKADFPDFDYAGPGYTSEDLKTRLRKNVRLVHAVLGITTEGAETSEAVINFLYGDSETLDVPNLQEENGDDSFYRAIMNDIFGFDFESTLQKNFEKLSKKRYKNGFSKDAAENRDLPGEREVFEK